MFFSLIANVTCLHQTEKKEYIYIYIYVYISAVKVNALMQNNFNGTHFFNARLSQRIFSVWPVAQPVVGEMEMHSVANLATLQTTLATFFPSKKCPNLVSENHLYCRARSCPPSARAHLSLSLSLRLLSFSSASGGEEQRFNSVKHRYYVASLILHASIVELSRFVDFSRLDDFENSSTSFCWHRLNEKYRKCRISQTRIHKTHY